MLLLPGVGGLVLRGCSQTAGMGQNSILQLHANMGCIGYYTDIILSCPNLSDLWTLDCTDSEHSVDATAVWLWDIYKASSEPRQLGVQYRYLNMYLRSG